MKKYLIAVCGTFLLSMAGLILVKAGYYTGPNNSLYVSTNTGWLWLEATLSNNTEEHWKTVYVQEGDEGSWSAFVEPSVHSVTHRDSRGILESQYSYVNPCWKFSEYGSRSCRS